MSSILFITPGTIDPIAITTLGVHVKDNASPIGFFGTGLKYAIATLLRNKQKITIQSAGNHYSFGTETTTVRGTDFEVVTMTTNGETTRLGFTTELGKTWELWMAYRELYSNTLDENGAITTERNANENSSSSIITVTGTEFAAVHSQRSKWFLELDGTERSLVSDDRVQIFSGSRGIFYRGIKVSNVETLFTYNITKSLTLTEDRTAKDLYEIIPILDRAIASCEDKTLIRSIACAEQNTWEGKQISFNYCSSEPSETFMRVVGDLHNRRDSALRNSALQFYLRYVKPTALLPVCLTKLERAMLTRALSALKTINITPTAEIIVTDTLGTDVLGEAKDGKILLSRRAFSMGTKMLAGTIFEEHVHLTEHHYDCSRGMQNYLIDKIMTCAEEIRGEPI